VPRSRERRGAVAAVLRVAALALLVAATGALAGQVQIGRNVSHSRTSYDWKRYFEGSWREVYGRVETTTTYDPADNPIVEVEGVPFALVRSSPVTTQTTTRTVARPGDPEVGTTSIDSVSKTADGFEVKTSFSLRQARPEPIAIGPTDTGIEVRPPPREVEAGGKRFRVSSVSRTVSIDALFVVPTFADLLAGGASREVREPGTKVETGSLRVVSPTGEAIGFYAGDERTARGEDFAELLD
jgi:hypothetical protein